MGRWEVGEIATRGCDFLWIWRLQTQRSKKRASWHDTTLSVPTLHTLLHTMPCHSPAPRQKKSSPPLHVLVHVISLDPQSKPKRKKVGKPKRKQLGKIALFFAISACLTNIIKLQWADNDTQFYGELCVSYRLHEAVVPWNISCFTVAIMIFYEPKLFQLNNQIKPLSGTSRSRVILLL